MRGYRLRGWFWQSTRSIRRRLRALKAALARLRYRLLRRDAPARVHYREAPPVSAQASPETPAMRRPLIAVAHQPDHQGDARQLLAEQTESAVVLWDLTQPRPEAATHLFTFEPGDSLEASELEATVPASLLESLLMVSETFACSVTTATTDGGGYLAGLQPESHQLWRLPDDLNPQASVLPDGVVGMAVPFLSHVKARSLNRSALLPEAGNALLSPWSLPTGTIHRASVAPLDATLAALPDFDSEPSAAVTALFLTPHLAIGGAERLLFHLLDQWKRQSADQPPPRAVVVTTEPHPVELGRTIADALLRTPHVFTLGDWLPRESLVGAVRHLLRRYQVNALVSWNGTTLFFDHLDQLQEGFPELRVSSQLFNHEGGWMERYGKSLIERIDVHLAIHSGIAREIEQRWQAPSATIEHAVPELEAPKAEHRIARRRELGIPEDALVVGGFFRLHPQKRPLDFVEVARRLEGSGVWFLLVGGGPLDAEVDAALDSERGGKALSNLVRLPLVQDTAPLFDALDLCLMCSQFEGLPVFVLEGLARAIPFVATPVGDLPALASSGTGWVAAQVGDIEGMEQTIRRLLTDAGSEEIEKAGELGRALVRERFSLARFADGYRAAIFGDGAEGARDSGFRDRGSRDSGATP